MTSPTNKPSKFRLQISLRMLLLLMAAVGVAIAVYRWPWEETKAFEISVASRITRPFLRQTTYRRDWAGKPVKHGRERVYADGTLLHEAHFHDGVLDGPRRAFDAQGQVVLEAHYRGGEEHGNFHAGDGQRSIWKGEYFKGERHGRWTTIVHRRTWQAAVPPPLFDDYFLVADGLPIVDRPAFVIPSEPIVAQQTWSRGVKHGEWSWKTLSGEELNQATYDQGELVTWNGQPVVEQFWQWLRSSAVNNPQLVAVLEAAERGNWECERHHPEIEHCLQFSINQGTPAESRLVMHAPAHTDTRNVVGPFGAPRSNSLAASLCAMAVADGFKFDYRYGTLWLVSAADPEPPFVDPTGVSQLAFEPGSTQERDWNEVVDLKQWKTDRSVESLLTGTSIKITTADPRALASVKFPPQLEQLLFTTRRRDILGMAFYKAELRCKRIGNSLKIGRQERVWKQKSVIDFGDLQRDFF